ncbi:DUF3244 domain-containing protein [Bacteroides thetaiotaomicron]|uniref:DUF3244 domain-containing protein n=1 Tax=Bacteroides thetaiotaomicron TaxID=818 RepID=UPI001CE2E00B|nr:DUF3244 domain-containing protein [Bacteroides thetaiotaomicron]MCA6009866.1 DUF3244 domain-containing protein [Bacteroides thetaiotaomicron]MCS2205226.1 DUF3244 domain-containing protein [Bacteroides thetaiotaomicron]MCS3305944.1 DUF3244 domain-containing protein [Bacteroides thetaiotaomicron]MDC2089635.1 DUF3244 domain-containing protein [Bacteroides thetaiotaomicron]MDC2098761.1 DUF3244 domain-containing protein [Bacteroides thetaiotaomicron]
MKKLLFLLFLGIFFSDLILGNSPNCNIRGCNMELSCSSRKIILKGKGSKPGETTRIPAIYPVEASINNNVLCLDFFSKVPSVTVFVINLDTNETVYLNTFINPVSLITLDLNLVEGTAYRLELLSKDYDLSGDFEL